MNGEPIEVFNHGDMYRDFTYIDDIVTGVERNNNLFLLRWLLHDGINVYHIY